MKYYHCIKYFFIFLIHICRSRFIYFFFANTVKNKLILLIKTFCNIAVIVLRVENESDKQCGSKNSIHLDLDQVKQRNEWRILNVLSSLNVLFSIGIDREKSPFCLEVTE